MNRERTGKSPAGVRVCAAALAAAFLASGYNGVVDRVTVVGSSVAFVMDDVTFGAATTVTPEPASLALVRQAYPEPKRRARAVATWAAGGSVAVALGPVAGGLLTTAWDWRGIFFAARAVPFDFARCRARTVARKASEERVSLRIDTISFRNSSLRSLSSVEGGGVCG